MRYTAPTDFRAVRVPGTRNYTVKADGYAFASLEYVQADVWAFRSEIAAELDTSDARLVRYANFARFLGSLKAAYLRFDRNCFEECAADMETERRAEQALEYFPQHAADTEWEDRMGMS